ncbi:MAG: hypothetical protein WBP34_00725, partial [Thermoanaerobaculia bacterium]
WCTSKYNRLRHCNADMILDFDSCIDGLPLAKTCGVREILRGGPWYPPTPTVTEWYRTWWRE